MSFVYCRSGSDASMDVLLCEYDRDRSGERDRMRCKHKYKE